MPGKYRPVSAADKRAMLEAAGKERPKCDCHGKPKKWAKTPQAPAGGRWCCSVKAQRANRKWLQNNPDAKSRWNQQNSRRLLGIPIDAPKITLEESGRRSTRARMLRKATSDKHAMNVIERIDPKRAKLMRLAVDKGASPYERRRALEKLDSYNINPRTTEVTQWQHSQTTSAGTRTPRHLPKSTSF